MIALRALAFAAVVALAIHAAARAGSRAVGSFAAGRATGSAAFDAREESVLARRALGEPL